MFNSGCTIKFFERKRNVRQFAMYLFFPYIESWASLSQTISSVYLVFYESDVKPCCSRGSVLNILVFGSEA